MALTDYTGLIVGGAGAAAGAFATFMSARAQKRSAHAEDRAAAFEGASDLVKLLQDDNRQLREELTGVRDRAMAAGEQQERVIQRQADQLHKLTTAMIGLRAIVLDEVAREAARDAIGQANPDMQRDVLRELLSGRHGDFVDERITDAGPPDGIERRGAGRGAGGEDDAGG